MPRFAFCIFCTMLAALLALMLMLTPSPAVAQEGKPSANVEFGVGEKVVGELACRVLMLGTDAPQPGFKLLAMAKYADRTNPTREILTDDKGAFTVKFKERPQEFRIFAFGSFFVPDAWSNVPVANMKFEKPETWDVRIRPMRPVTVSGTVRIVPGGKTARAANVVLAALDVDADGTSRVFDQPYRTMSNDDGTYSLDVPSGYYMMWAYWWDRDLKDWPGYIKVLRKVEVFADKTVALDMSESPTIRGKVIDARTGQGIAANIDLFSNQYLSFRNIRTADGRFSDEYPEDGKEVFWPVGTFRKQFWMVDPDNFTAVIRPAETKAVLKIVPNLKLADLAGREVRWELYGSDMPVLDVQVTTHKHDIPVNEIDVQLLPKDVEIPDALKLSLEAGSVTDAQGKLRFVGLPRGQYEVYVNGGSSFLGKVKIDGGAQSANFKFAIPFAFGEVRVPFEARRAVPFGVVNLKGTRVSRDMKVFISMTDGEGRSYDPAPNDPFYHNSYLRRRGTVFVPLLRGNATFKVSFAAFENGREFTEDEYADMNSFPLITDEQVMKPTGEDTWELNLMLKPNPDFKKYEPRKPR